MRVAVGLLGALLALASPASAQTDVVSERPDAVSVTIYRDGVAYTPEPGQDFEPEYGLALVTETRTVDLPAGPARVVFRGVADNIVSQTAAVEGLGAPLIERNQDYNLLSPGSLIRKWIDKPVTLVRTNPETGAETHTPAVLRSGPYGVMMEVEGRLEAFRCGGPPERLVFDAPPEGMVDRPTLSVLTNAAEGGRRTVRLSYLTTGLTWSADYVVRLRPDGETLDLTGWVTLVNGTSTSFPDAPTQVVAGNLARDEDTEPVAVRAEGFSARCWPMDTTTRGEPPRRQGTGEVFDAPIAISAFNQETLDGGYDMLIVTAQKRVDASELGDYKLYTLPEPTTVAARQTKQVLMLEQPGVRFEPVYLFVMDRYLLDDMPDVEEGEALSPVSVLRLDNRKADGLGVALPGGTVTVLGPDGTGRMAVVGEDRVPDGPVGQPLEIELGNAMNVLVWPRVVEESDIKVADDTWERRKIEVVVANGRDRAVTLEYMHSPEEEGFRLVSSSRRHGSKQGGPLWTFRLRPGERQTLHYTVDEAR